LIPYGLLSRSDLPQLPNAMPQSAVAISPREVRAGAEIARARFRPAMVWLLAWRNLVQDRVRFIATLVGVAFSVVLMAVQWGLLIGSADTASGLVDHAGADFWVASRGTPDVDQGVPLPERWRFKALSVP